MADELEATPDQSTVKLDLLTDHVNQLVTKLDAVLQHETRGNTQTIVHKTAGMGAWAAAAVTACFMTFLALILFALIVLPEMHDLKAWSDIYRTRIQELSQKAK